MRMRVALVIIIGATAVSLPSYCEEIYCKEITPTHFNDVWGEHIESKFQINYDEPDGEFIFYLSEAITTFAFSLTRAEADSLVSRVEKYKAWNIKASQKEVKLQKEIGTFKTKWTGWKLGDDWSFGPGCDVSIVFFSQTEDVHQLVFVFPKVTSRSNEYDTHKAETIYFGWDDAKLLGEVLAASAVDKWLTDVKAQKALEDEFQ